MFEIIPAVDILDGKCVRLTQGKFEAKTVYSDNPVEVATSWEKIGAKRLHVIDLDGARTGTLVNFPIIKEIVKSVNIPIQVGGGIRELHVVREAFEAGIDRVVLGTIAIKKPHLLKEICDWYGEHVAISIDSREGKAALEGWTEISDKSPIDLAKEAIEAGISRIIYTDISRDGTLEGPNIEGIKEFAKSVIVPVIASGGIGKTEDVLELKKLVPYGVEGCIIGKALYSGAIKLEELL